MDFDSTDTDPPANTATTTHPIIPTPVQSSSGFLPAEIWYKIFNLLLDEEDIPALQSLGRVSRQLRENILAEVPFILTSREQHAQICRAVKPPRLLMWYGVEVCKFLAKLANLPEQDFPFRLNLLYCSGCKCRHPARAFSQAERRKPDRRICIGREGYVRLCEHKTLTWAQVEEALRNITIEANITIQAQGYRQYPSPFFEEREEVCDMCRMSNDNGTRMRFRLREGTVDLVLYVEWESNLCLGDRRVNSMARDWRCKNRRCQGPEKGTASRHFCDKANDPKKCTRSIMLPTFHSKTISFGAIRLHLPPFKPGEPPEAWLRFNPHHDWFHAVDPMSYTHEDSRHSQSSSPDLDMLLHLCKDSSCEYYRYEYQVRCPYDAVPPWHIFDRRITRNQVMPLSGLHFPLEHGDEGGGEWGSWSC
ncbi:hypothetical protein QBC37DRAFT_398701 [Rhypophila decipiens]|uniref:F-box domain-containing protein n=1 Tax=Rhypophila decipiens TaxID=261697 RepID=A0AAN6YF26_9PEZI|nr:hypothetical protein QBC37DRAFT_398701 [Rhypophila decipiens]